MGLKLAGATYDEVHAAGGGINRTVTATRQASHGTLTMTALRRLDKMTAAGTTHVEIKSGYGMDWETELKMLQVGWSTVHPLSSCRAHDMWDLQCRNRSSSQSVFSSFCGDR